MKSKQRPLTLLLLIGLFFACIASPAPAQAEDSPSSWKGLERFHSVLVRRNEELRNELKAETPEKSAAIDAYTAEELERIRDLRYFAGEYGLDPKTVTDDAITAAANACMNLEPEAPSTDQPAPKNQPAPPARPKKCPGQKKTPAN